MSLTVTENCPICGGPMYTYYSADSEFHASSKLISKTICSNCGYEKPELISYTYATGGSDLAVGSIDLNPYKHITINADTLRLHQKGINITIDISNEILSNIEDIEINGFKFTKENQP